MGRKQLLVERGIRGREKGWQSSRWSFLWGISCGVYRRQILHFRNSKLCIIIFTIALSLPTIVKVKNYSFFMFSYLSMLFQDPTFLETAFEMSKTGIQFMKDTTQRNGESEPVSCGKRMLGPAEGMSPGGGQLGFLHLGGTGCQERLGNHLCKLREWVNCGGGERCEVP